MSRINLSESEIRKYFESRVQKLRESGKKLRGPCPIRKGARESLAVNCEVLAKDLDFLSDRDADLWTPLFSLCRLLHRTALANAKNAPGY